MLTTKNWEATSLSLIVASAVVWLAGCTPPGPRSLLEGDKLIQEQKYAEALEKLKTAVELLPQNANAWNHLGLAYHGTGQPVEAAKAYRRALQQDPNLAVVHYNFGCLLLEQNLLPAAISELTGYTVLARNSVEGWLKLGAAQLRSRQLEAAEKSFRSALQINPALPEAMNNLGVIQMQRNRAREAALQFGAALQQEPRYPPALLNSAIVLQQPLNNRHLALQYYRAYLDSKPDPRHVGAISEIVRHLDLELNPPPKVAIQTNRPAPPVEAQPAAIASTNPAPARTNTVAAVPTARPNTQTNLAAAGPSPASQPQKNETKPATTRDDQRTAVAANDSAAPKPAAQTEERPAANEPAISRPESSLPKATEPEPTKSINPINTDRSPSNVVSGTVTNDPGPGAGLLISRRTPKKKDKPGIMERLNPLDWFRSKDKQDQPSPKTDETKRGTKVTALETTPAAAGGTQSPPAPPRPSFPRYAYRSPAKPAAGDRAQAEAIFSQALKAHRERRIEEAMAKYREATRLDPSFFEAHYNLGLAAYDAKDFRLSLSAYENALSINATSVDARYNFAFALQQAKYVEDAANELERVVAVHPEEVRAHFALAKIYADSLTRADLARDHYRTVLQLEPQHAQASAIRYWLAAHP